MDHVLPAGKVFQAGTLSGNPLATAAGHRHAPRAARRSRPTTQLEAAQRAAGRRACIAAASAAGVPHTVARVGSMLTLFFNPARSTDWATASPVRHGARSPGTSGA